MTAVEITRPGGPDVLVSVQRPVPAPADDEVLIRIHAAGVNGPDVFQRKGLYDPPPGASDIPGLEVAGEIVSVGRDVTRFAVGDMVCALVPGGGYAEYTVAHERNTLTVPDGLSMIEAAAMPETFLTVWLNLFQRGRFAAGESVLIHGGASGIGTTATMLAKAFGASKIITTVSSDAQRTASIALGADVAVDYRKEDFVKAVMDATDGRGVDVVVDIIAGDYVARNYAAAAIDGRIVQIGVIKGPAQALDLFPMLAKRLMHIGSTLRSRTHEEKAELIEDLKRSVWPHIRRGAVKPAIFQTFDLNDACGAHALMDSGLHIGKIVLTCR
jgi:NADPH2:quinone reductase